MRRLPRGGAKPLVWANLQSLQVALNDQHAQSIGSPNHFRQQPELLSAA